jgi:hypothetical protein
MLEMEGSGGKSVFPRAGAQAARMFKVRCTYGLNSSRSQIDLEKTRLLHASCFPPCGLKAGEPPFGIFHPSSQYSTLFGKHV